MKCLAIYNPPTPQPFSDKGSLRLTLVKNIPHICHFFTQAKFLENKIYTEKTRKLRQNTQKIANFLRYYGKIHSKLPIFRVKSVKIYTGQFFFYKDTVCGVCDKYQVWPPRPCTVSEAFFFASVVKLMQYGTGIK